MKKPFLALLLLALPALPLPQPAPAPQAPRPLVFTHVTVLDMTGAPARPDMAVVITGERITEVGRSGSVRVPRDAQVVDATGKFLIPGLWDMHVHWFHQDYLPLFLANGVTGIRMMWGMPIHHQWRQEIEQGTLRGPRMVIASPIVDGPRPIWPGSIAIKDAAEGRQFEATPAYFYDLPRRRLSLLLEYLQNQNGIWIDPIEDPPCYVGVADSQLMAARGASPHRYAAA